VKRLERGEIIGRGHRRRRGEGKQGGVRDGVLSCEARDGVLSCEAKCEPPTLPGAIRIASRDGAILL
jgi:hypothetical protein